jgi:hypothetical protein
LETLASRSPAPQRRHVGFDPGLVEEDQPGASILFWGAFQRCRLRAISGLSCSVGRFVFFEAQALGVNENPNRTRICLDATLGQLHRQLPQCERAGSDPLPQPVGIRLRGSASCGVWPFILPGFRPPVSRRSFFHLEMQDGLISSASRTVSPASAQCPFPNASE